MNTIPLESMGNESTAQNMTAANTGTLRESIETTTVFDTKKWKKMINGNVDMIQRKVDQSTPHHVLYRELDDLKMIVSNCFDQLSRSLGRQIEIAKNEATQLQRVALENMSGLSPQAKLRGLNRDASISGPLLSPGGTPGLNLENVEVLNRIQKATQDANEIMR